MLIVSDALLRNSSVSPLAACASKDASCGQRVRRPSTGLCRCPGPGPFVVLDLGTSVLCLSVMGVVTWGWGGCVLSWAPGSLSHESRPSSSLSCRLTFLVVETLVYDPSRLERHTGVRLVERRDSDQRSTQFTSVSGE